MTRIAPIGMMVVVMAVASRTNADPHLRLDDDDLLPLVDPPLAMQPKSDHRIDMLAAATEARHDRLWQAIDVTALALSTAALVIDWRQTHGAAADNWRTTQEVGVASMAVGSSPSTRVVDGYFAATIAVNAALWALLPRRWRSAIPLAVIGIETSTIVSNLPRTHI